MSQSHRPSYRTILDRLSPSETALLNVLAWFAPEPVPQELLLNTNSNAIWHDVVGAPQRVDFDSLPVACGDSALVLTSDRTSLDEEKRFTAAGLSARNSLATLVDCGLVCWHIRGDSVIVPSEIQEVVRSGQSSPEKWLTAALRLLKVARPPDPKDEKNWPRWESLRPHIQFVTQRADNWKITDEVDLGTFREPNSVLIDELVEMLLQKGLDEPIVSLQRRALNLDIWQFGAYSRQVRLRLNSLGQALRNANCPFEAELSMRRALSIGEQSFGADDPDIVTELKNLADLLRATRRWTEAESLMRRVQAIHEKTLGSEHLDVAEDLNRLAELLEVTNRHAEAEGLMRRALAIVEKWHGAGHPATAAVLDKLAGFVNSLIRPREAESLMRQALFIDATVYDHWKVAVRLNNLAKLLRDNNQLGQAEPLMRRALAIDEQFYGVEHPIVAMQLKELADLLTQLNRASEALPLMERATTILERELDALHPAVVAMRDSLPTPVEDRSEEPEHSILSSLGGIPRDGRILLATRCIKRMNCSCECLPTLGDAIRELAAQTIAALEQPRMRSSASRFRPRADIQKMIEECIQAKKAVSKQMDFDQAIEIQGVIKYLTALDYAVGTVLARKEQTSIQFAEWIAELAAMTEEHRDAQRMDLDTLRRAVEVHGWTDDSPISADILGPLWPQLSN